MRTLLPICLCLALPVSAQENTPPDPGMRALRVEVGDGAPLSYIGTRCAAFFVASAAALGDQLDDEMQAQVNDITALLLMTAANAMSQVDGMPRDEARDAAAAEATTLTEAYRLRFAENQAAGRPAFAEDAMYMADNEDCLAVLTGEDVPDAQ